ncbi:hypothetical protein LIA64_002655 [Salmonella enterica]|nr:hypothetical protein [Salmonella enterica]
MRNFAKLQKSAKWQKNAILIEMQLNRLVMHFNKALEIMRGTKAGQRDEVSDITDFKGFFICDERDTTASAGSGTQPPHPPLGGWGLSRPSRHGFYSHSVRMQCLMQQNTTAADFRQNRKILQKQCRR